MANNNEQIGMMFWHCLQEVKKYFRLSKEPLFTKFETGLVLGLHPSTFSQL